MNVDVLLCVSAQSIWAYDTSTGHGSRKDSELYVPEHDVTRSVKSVLNCQESLISRYMGLSLQMTHKCRS